MRHDESVVKLADDREQFGRHLGRGGRIVMEQPQIRPGVTHVVDPLPRVVDFFRNAAPGNLVIQLLLNLGVSAEHLAVTPPEQVEGGVGMLLSIGCREADLIRKVEALCGAHGAEIHRQTVS